MRYLTHWAVLALACSVAAATEPPKKNPPSTQPPSKAASAPAKLSPPTKVTAVTSVGPGQAGFVHYFLITHPDESLEYQVGVELEDQRIAWSFPMVGVSVSEFIKKGTLQVNGARFKIEHLHGIRPYADDAQMRVLQKELTQRVVQWVDNETPYCLIRQPGGPFCLSCGDFVVRILYPGATPVVPALPQDFLREFGKAYNTDDLLLYLVGVYNLPDKKSKLARLASLDLPTSMRDDIIAMIDDDAPNAPPANLAVATPVPPFPGARAAPAKPPASKMASRRPQNKRL